MNAIKDVTDWVMTARQKKNNRNLANYIAYTLSECSEMLSAIHSVDIHDAVDLGKLSRSMEHMSKLIREGFFDDLISKANKVELMDAAFDTAWTSIGVMDQLGDAEGAWQEGTNSNYSKFCPTTGHATLDDTGKVVKPSTFEKPDFEGFIC